MNFEFECKDCRICETNCSIFLETGKGAAYEKLNVIKRLSENGQLTKDDINIIFRCTKCEACQEICPEDIPLMDLYDWARDKIFSRHGARNEKQQGLIQNILNYGNPFGNEGSRLIGVDETLLKQKLFKKSDESPPSRILLHFGCMLGYRLQSMRDDSLKILELLGVDYCLLENEICCGYFIWNTGDHESANKIIAKNQQFFKEFDKIICACAGCYTFFRENYPNPEKFVHFIEVVDERIRELSVKPTNMENRKKSYIFHDSCHLTRPHKIVQPPRTIMKALGMPLKEFSHRGEEGLCCGADGGMRISNPKLANRIGLTRVQEADHSGADTLLTLCPFCIFNFRDSLPNNWDGITIGSLYREIKEWLADYIQNK
ncbi:MAG: (Fe-S)-binding protein [Promethearchaeia archaeon]